MYSKRIVACSIGAVISAAVCLTGSQIIHGWPPLSWHIFSVTAANRLLLGLVIALSSWRTNHLLHGAVLGLVVSLTVSVGFLPDRPLDFSLYTGAGILYGLFIEILATNVFKAPVRTPH